MQRPGRRQRLIGALIPLTLLVTLLYLWGERGSTPSPSEAPPAEGQRDPQLGGPAQGDARTQATAAPPRDGERRSAPPSQAPAQTSLSDAPPADASADPGADPTPPAMPRTVAGIDFADRPLPPGDAQGVATGPEGLTLTEAYTAANPRRIGHFVSEAVTLDFPANALSPLWKAETPPGTHVEIALSLSPDGAQWTDFRSAPPDLDSAAQMSPTYPDGRPNPFYGYTPGGVMAFGLSLFSQVRYRLTLSSEGPATPRLLGIRLYYQDTTLGKGRLATLPTPQTVPLETSP